MVWRSIEAGERKREKERVHGVERKTKIPWYGEASRLVACVFIDRRLTRCGEEEKEEEEEEEGGGRRRMRRKREGGERRSRGERG